MSLFQRLVSWFLPDYIVPSHISEEVLNELLLASENQHPSEFLALLIAESTADVTVSTSADVGEYIITSYYIIPGTVSNSVSATIQSVNVPIGAKIVGSFHSHPNGVLSPSTADKNMFQKYPVNIISGYPYNNTDWQAFNHTGQTIPLTQISVSETVHSSKADEFSNF